MYYVLCPKIYSTLGSLFWTPADSRRAVKGARFCGNVLFLSQKASKNGRLREPALVKMAYAPHKVPVTRKMFPFDDVIMVLPCVVIYQDKSIYVKLLK